MLMHWHLRVQDRRDTIVVRDTPPDWVSGQALDWGRAMSYSWGASRNPARPNGARLGGLALDAAPVSPVRSGDGMGPSRPDVDGPGPVTEQHRVAAELAPMVEVWQRLLAQHVPDRAGRCRTCTKGGTGLPSTPWPCAIHGIADLARRRYDADHR
jgi:hypothetical protein